MAYDNVSLYMACDLSLYMACDVSLNVDNLEKKNVVIFLNS